MFQNSELKLWLSWYPSGNEKGKHNVTTNCASEDQTCWFSCRQATRCKGVLIIIGAKTRIMWRRAAICIETSSLSPSYGRIGDPVDFHCTLWQPAGILCCLPCSPRSPSDFCSTTVLLKCLGTSSFAANPARCNSLSNRLSIYAQTMQQP